MFSMASIKTRTKDQHCSTDSVLKHNTILEDITQACRVCMKVRKKMRNLFQCGNKLVEKIHFCTGIRIPENPRLSTSICQNCESELSIAHKFKKKILNTHTFEVFKTLNSVGKCMKNIKKNVFNKSPIGVKIIDDIICLTNDEHVKNDASILNEYIKNDESIQKDNFNYNVSDEYNKIKNEVCVQYDDIKNEVSVQINSIKKDASASNDGIQNDFNIIKNDVMIGDINDMIDDDDVDFKLIVNAENVTDKRSKQDKDTNANKLFTSGSCIYCDKNFKNKVELAAHKREFHKEQSHICDICGQTLKSFSSLNSHMKLHSAPQFSCSQCDYKTHFKKTLANHVTIHNGEKSIVCSYCSARFRLLTNLRSHVRIVHLKRKTHFCTECDASFFNSTKLNRHLDSHANIKRYECEVCHACFTRRCHWKIHLLKKHNISTPPLQRGRQTRHKQLHE